MNNYISKSFEKNYTGKWELASATDIETNPKYQDKNVYRFILSDQTWSSSSSRLQKTNTFSGNPEFSYDNSYSMDFHLYDRLNDKNYPSFGVESSVPAKAINRTSALLNKKLKG